MSDAPQTHIEPLGLIAHRLIEIIETTLRAGGNPHLPDAFPGRIDIALSARRTLNAARDLLLHELLAECHEQQLLGPIVRMAELILASRATT